MAAEQQGRPTVHPFEEDVLEHVDGERVEPGERLVQHQELRVVGQGQCQLHPLLVAARQVLHRGGGAVGQPHPLEPPIGRGLGLASLEPRQSGEVHDVVAHPHLGVEAALGRHVPHPMANLLGDRAAVPGDGTPVDADEAEDGAHGRGLPRAVGAEEADELPPADGEADAVEGAECAVALLEVGDVEHPSSPTARFGPLRSAHAACAKACERRRVAELGAQPAGTALRHRPPGERGRSRRAGQAGRRRRPPGQGRRRGSQLHRHRRSPRAGWCRSTATPGCSRSTPTATA